MTFRLKEDRSKQSVHHCVWVLIPLMPVVEDRQSAAGLVSCNATRLPRQQINFATDLNE